MTATATIEVKYVNPPKNGNPKASWSIKDGHGSYWGFYPEKVGKPNPGETITVEWTESEYQGKTYKNIAKILKGDTAPASNGSAAPPRPAQDDETPLRIFLCGVLNNAIQTGKVDPFDGAQMTDCLFAAKEAYSNVFKSR